MNVENVLRAKGTAKGTQGMQGMNSRKAKGQKGKRYGKSMNKGLLKKHAAKVAKDKSAPRLNVACARKIMYARKYTTYIQTIMYAQYTYI